MLKLITNIARPRSIFLKFLASNIIILLVAMLIGVTAYFKAGQIIEEEANRYNEAMLNQVSQAIDTQLRDMEQLAVQVAYDKTLMDISYVNEPDRPSYEQSMSQLLKNIFEYKSRSRFIHDLYIYLKNYDTIINPAGCFNPDFFYNNLYGYKNVEYSKWHDLLFNFNEGPQYMPLQTVQASKWTRNLITYFYPLHRGTEGNTGNLVILIDEQQIHKLLKNIEIVNNGTLYVVDGQNRLITSTLPNQNLNDFFSVPDIPFLDLLNGKSGLIYNRIDGKDVVVSYTMSNVNNWKYISIVPTHIFMDKAENIRNFTVMVIITSLLVGILLACLMAYSNYNPIKKLISDMKNKLGKFNNSYDKNEYDLIKEVIDSTIDESMKIKDILEEQRPALKSNFLCRLIYGTVETNIDLVKSLDFFDIRFTSERFSVMLISLDNCGDLVKGNSEQEWALARLITGNAFEEIANMEHKVYTVELQRQQLALLVNINNRIVDNSDSKIYCMAEETKKLLAEKYGFVLTIAIGRIYSGIDSICKSFNEATIASNYKIARGCNSIICYTGIQADSSSYYYPLEVEYKLINFIKAGEIVKAEDIINNIFKENFSERNLSYRLIQCLFFDIMSTAIKTLNEIKIKYEDIFGIHFDPVSQILKCQTAEEMRRTVISIYKQLCDYLVDNRKSHNIELKDRIIGYIGEHYGDMNLSVTVIADEMRMNPSYLSTFFKEQTDITLTDYINTVRIEKAEEFIRDKSLTISDISVKLGYGTTNSFIRVFKKYKGLTPGEYRNKLTSKEI